MARADTDSTASDTDDVERCGDVGSGAYGKWEDTRVFAAYFYATWEKERWRGESNTFSADERVGDAIDADLYSVERWIKVSAFFGIVGSCVRC